MTGRPAPTPMNVKREVMRALHKSGSLSTTELVVAVVGEWNDRYYQRITKAARELETEGFATYERGRPWHPGTVTLTERRKEDA